MRIAVIAPPWVPVPPPAYGGTERVIDDLCCALVADGHDVLLATTGDSTCPVARVWTFETALSTERAAPAAELRHVLAAYEAAIEWGADIVHDHTMSGPFVAARHPDLAVVTTNHGPFNADLAPIYAGHAGCVPVIAISHHQASTAGDLPVAAVIHHGVNPDTFPIGSGAGDYAVFLGRMCPEKGVHTAVEIARRAGIPLRIAAKMREKDEHDYFAERVKPLLGGDVEYLGEVGGHDKLALLADATCLLNPIAWPEPFGMVMVEALACGTPVVGSACGAAPEIVDDGLTGWLRRDPHALVTALGEVGDLDRGACRAAVETRFSAKRMATEHAELFEVTVLGDGRRAA